MGWLSPREAEGEGVGGEDPPDGDTNGVAVTTGRGEEGGGAPGGDTGGVAVTTGRGEGGDQSRGDTDGVADTKGWIRH